MLMVIALGGNALLKHGEAVSAEAQRNNVRIAAAQLAKAAAGNDLVIVHGNGPQVGMLALQAGSFPLDVLDAETEGMIGYMIEQEMRNLLPAGRACVSLLSMVEMSASDPAFEHPDKPIGSRYAVAEAAVASQGKGWTVTAQGDKLQRVVPSPKPVRMLEIEPVRWLLEHSCVVICAGCGGIPVVADAEGRHRGVKAVVDKDRSAAMLAAELKADLFVIATDVQGVYLDWRKPSLRSVARANPAALGELAFSAGSMAPKVEAACDFASRTGRRSVIGALSDIEAMIAGNAGTSIDATAAGIEEAVATQPS
ncbi:carbamate kinase [Caballeronia sp. 15715]|uniref:carbamate kinase n=1 Tax=Caballeronia sp. 15715 TaxID=3391030 RepID=UPI0039E23E02